jgi:Cu-processing system ATP-binding protein
MTDDALIVQDVVKRYGDHVTVSGVSLTVRAGERIALLGHNGAGKTTLMKLVLGLTPLDGGRISVFGATPGDRTARRLSAYLPESVAFNKVLTGREQLRLFARLSGDPVAIVDPLLERVGLGEAARRRIGTWSKGMRQRLGLAQTLIGRPRLALLDEPTSGLDPISRHEFYAIVDEMVAAGTAVLISSHALTELEARTDRIAILRDGHLVANDSLAHLHARAQLPIRVRVVAHGDGADQLADRLGGQRINGHAVEFFCAPGEKMGRLTQITALGGLIDDIEVVPPSLEDLYRHYSTGQYFTGEIPK